jgi:hypothetical protein
MKFNPYGLHAIHIPLGLLTYDGATQTRKSLSWGAKAFYGRLALFLGKPKAKCFCSPDLETMAEAMGVSQDTVGRWLAELIAHNFIRRIRRGRGPSECVFLAHPCLVPDGDESNSSTLRTQNNDSDSAELWNQSTNSNCATLRNQSNPCSSYDAAPLQVSTPQFCGHNSATLRLPY